MLKEEGDERKKISFKEASKRVTKHHSKLNLSDIALQYQAKVKEKAKQAASRGQRIAHDGEVGEGDERGKRATIPLDEWRNIVKKLKKDTS